MLYEVITQGQTPLVHGQVGAARTQQGEKAGAGHLLDGLDDNDPGIPLPAVALRITSYNVCYTKLLRRARGYGTIRHLITMAYLVAGKLVHGPSCSSALALRNNFV